MKIYCRTFFSILLMSTVGIGVVACQKQASTPDISNGVTVDDLHTVADSNETYDDLNHDSTITETVASSITNRTGITVEPEWDFVLVNDQDPNAIQTAGTAVLFTAKSISNTSQSSSGFELISGSFSFSDTLSFGDISYGVKLADQIIKYADVANESYYELTNNQSLVTKVINAISSQKSISVAWKQDFILKNNQEPSNMVTLGDICKFRVLTLGDKIKGAFEFKVTIN